MDQQKIDAIAQTILSLSSEERQLLEQKVDTGDVSAKTSDLLTSELSAESKSFRVAELAQDIATYESKYAAQPPETLATAIQNSPLSTDSGLSANQAALSSFFELTKSLNIQGPADWSSRVDDYLNEDAISTHE